MESSVVRCWIPGGWKPRN